MGEADRTRIGIVRKPHGIKGGVKISAEPEILDALPEIDLFFVNTGTEWQTLHLEGLAGTAADPILYFEEIPDRDAADHLRDAEVWVRKEQLPGLAEGEYYVADLVGCEVLDEDGTVLGRVREVTRPSQHEVLVIEAENGETLIPFVEAWINDVDLEQRRIHVVSGEEI